MTKEQKIVAAGAATGILFMAAALAALSAVMPHLTETAGSGERLAFAARWCALAAAPLLVALAAVGNARFNSDAIDPTAGKESHSLIVNGRVADNTLQQYVLFFAACFAFAAGATGSELSVIAAAAIVFIVARIAFWIGYRINPLYRAAGMAATSYQNLLLFGLASWVAWR